MEVVENADNIEICVMSSDSKITMVEQELLERVCAEISKEKLDAEEAKKKSNQK